MSDLKFIEKSSFEQLFDMGGGYVLDFSNQTFASFFTDYNVEIYHDRYNVNGNSKANRLRAFWELESNDLAGRVLRDMVQYAAQRTDSKELEEKCFAICDRLTGNSSDSETSNEENFLAESLDINVNRLRLNPDLEKVIQQRLEEISNCLSAGASLSVIFLCGSTLEGLLLNQASANPAVYNKSKSSPKGKDGCAKPFNEWALNDFINVSYECRFIKKDVKDFSHSLRNFRNYVHPHQQMVEVFFPDKHTAKIACQVLKAAIADLSGDR